MRPSTRASTGNLEPPFRCLVQFQARFTHVEYEEVREFYGCGNLEAFPQGRGEIVGWSLCAERRSNGEIEILRRARPVEPQLKRVPTLQDPTVTRRQARVEHAYEKPIERDLAPQTMQINRVATRPFEQANFEGRPQRPGCCVLTWSDHRAPVSGRC